MKVDLETLRQYNVEHPAQQTALRDLLRSIEWSRNDRKISCLIGPAGVGKGRLATLLIEKLTVRGKAAPVTLVAPPEVGSRAFSMLGLLRLILEALGDPDPDHHSLPRQALPRDIAPDLSLTGARMLVAVRERLRARCPSAVVIDEANYIAEGTARQVQANMRDLTWLADNVAVPIVLIGTYDTLALGKVATDVNRRLRYTHFPRYGVSSRGALALARAVGGFEAYLVRYGLATKGSLVTPEGLKELRAGSEGCVGVLSDWIWIGVQVAAASDRKLTLDDLRSTKTAVVADLEDFRKKLHSGEEDAHLAGHKNIYARVGKDEIDKSAETTAVAKAKSPGLPEAARAQITTEMLPGVVTEPIERRRPVGTAKLQDLPAFRTPAVA